MINNSMKIFEVENKHPFNYAYNVQNPQDASALKQAYTWAANAYGSDLPMPEVLVANHDHMQRAAAQAHHNTVLSGQVFGWYSQKYKTVYISDKLHPGRDKRAAAVMVHEFIHYMQDHDNKPNDVDALENEADEYMAKYFTGR
jgi:hypothetical protein